MITDSKELLKCAMNGVDVSRYWCNNWRKRRKLPLIRSGSGIVKLKMKYEHKTTKKQKMRWRKKHIINPFDIEVN